MTTNQVQESRGQNGDQIGEMAKAADQAGATGVRKAGRQLKLKEMLRRLGQEGRKKVVEEGQEISLARESQQGQGQKKKMVTRIDKITVSKKNNISEDQLIPGLVTPKITRYGRSVGSEHYPSKIIIEKVHTDVYKGGHIPSRKHNPLEVQEHIVDIVGKLTSDEDGGHRGSRSPPGT